eukprot:scaffold34159_cov96-Isochrysis_galbana.AAC.1
MSRTPGASHAWPLRITSGHARDVGRFARFVSSAGSGALRWEKHVDGDEDEQEKPNCNSGAHAGSWDKPQLGIGRLGSQAPRDAIHREGGERQQQEEPCEPARDDSPLLPLGRVSDAAEDHEDGEDQGRKEGQDHAEAQPVLQALGPADRGVESIGRLSRVVALGDLLPGLAADGVRLSPFKQEISRIRTQPVEGGEDDLAVVDGRCP